MPESKEYSKEKIAQHCRLSHVPGELRITHMGQKIERHMANGTTSRLKQVSKPSAVREEQIVMVDPKVKLNLSYENSAGREPEKA